MTQPALFGVSVLHPVGRSALVGLDKKQEHCRSCPLGKTRTRVVPGEGCADSPPVMFIGEGPGENEDRQGRPFVGRAGELLDRMIAAMGFKREHVYITNVVGCRPPENRQPEPEEIKACAKHLFARIHAVRPKVIVTLGATASQTIVKTMRGIGELRGRWFEFEKIPVMCTYHPAFLLRPNGMVYKKDVWQDLQEVLRKIGAQNDSSG